MNSYCKVYGCRYSWSHSTFGHKCGNCKKHGHGLTECGNIDKINNLKQFYDELPNDLQCKIKGCRYKKYHISMIYNGGANPDLSSVKLEFMDDIHKLIEVTEKLYALLDDIDTASDMFKPTDEKSYKAFYEYVMKKCEERSKWIESDGYDLYVK